MRTEKIYKEIDKTFTQRLKDNGLAYNLRKIRNIDIWRLQIGKFTSITSPYLQVEINGYGNIDEQFSDILKLAISEKL